MTESNAPRNPYEIGTPITDQKSFFGRESLFRDIEDHLRRNVKIILLHGQRRIGKSSILKQIPNFVAPNEFIFVHFDLQGYSASPLNWILCNLSESIIKHPFFQNAIEPLSKEDIINDESISIFEDHFLTQVNQVLDSKKLVLLLDEFDVVSNNTIVDKGLNFFPYLEKLLKQQEKLFIIPVIGRYLNDMPELVKLFKDAPVQEIGLLDEVSAKRMITKPGDSLQVEYDQEALRAIRELSVGHPYFTQVICFTLFGEARHQNNWKVTLENVQEIVDKAIGNAEGGLVWFWDGLYTPEQVVFSAVAEAQEIANEQSDQRFPEDPFKVLKNYGVIQTEALTEAAEQLAKKGFLDDTKRRVKVELVRRWLVKAHPLHREIMELEKLEAQKVNSIYQEATKLDQEGKKQDALAQYEKVLEINPNYFSALVPLAEGYLEVEEFDKAVEFYDRAYKVNPMRNKQGFVNALERYGDKLKTQRQFTKAKEQYNCILAIEPNKGSVEQKLREIDTEIGDSASQVSVNNSVQDYSHSHKSHRILIGGIIAIAVGIVFVGTSVYRLINPCLPWERKIYGVICKPESSNISRGEKSFLFVDNNKNRDLAFEEFKKQNYSNAANFFNKVVKRFSNTPEALIYYNNAIARQKGSPLTLAVVVPIKTKLFTALEMLRGVAQAQDQFNQNDGLNHRLLEIVIADDGNKPDQAKQVAQELVNDESVLGVIGHYSSTTTEATLTEYENANLPIISPSATSTELKHGKAKVFFRTGPSDALGGQRLAEYVKNKLNVNKVVIFYSKGKPYSESLKNEFTSNFKQLGGSTRRNIDLSDANFDAEQEVQRSVSEQVHTALLFPDSQDTFGALEIAKANVKLPMQKRLRLLGGDTLYDNSTILKYGREAVEGLISYVPWFRDDQQSKEFADTSLNRWKGDVSWLTATSFDATQAFLQALRLSPSLSRDNILQKLPDVKLDPNQTSGYPLQFQDGERRDSKPILVKVEGGKFKIEEGS